MGLNAKKLPQQSSGFRQEPLDEGTYPARLVCIYDLGLQKGNLYQGKRKPTKQKLIFVYELLDEFCFDEEGNELTDKPRWVKEDFPFHPLSSDLAASTKRYNALDPEDESDGEFPLLLGKPCLVTIVNNEDKKGKKDDKGNPVIYNNIGNVSAMRKRDRDKAAELVNEPKVFLLDEPDMEVWKGMPEWIQNRIKGGIDFESTKLAKLLSGKEEEGGKDEPDVNDDAESYDDDTDEGENKPW